MAVWFSLMLRNMGGLDYERKGNTIKPAHQTTSSKILDGRAVNDSTNQIPLSERLRVFCVQNRLEILYVFGSRAGEISRYVKEGAGIAPENSSDVDIAVRVALDRRLSVKDKVEMTSALEDLLGVDHVDLAFLHEADPFLAANIIRGERLFCMDEYLADEYELYILRRAADLAPFERIRMEHILNSSEAI